VIDVEVEMGGGWNGLWLTLAFLAELGALVALGHWGLAVGGSTAVRLLLAVGAPLTAAVLWGLFAAPRATFDVPVLAVAVKLLVFGSAVLALVTTGHPRLAAALGVVALLSSVLSTPPTGAVTGPAAR
jgi:hypothetical protein